MTRAILFAIRPILELPRAVAHHPLHEPGRRHHLPPRDARRLRLRGPLRRRPRRAPRRARWSPRTRPSNRSATCPKTSRRGSGRSRCPWSGHIQGEDARGDARPGPGDGGATSASPASSATPCRWTWSIARLDPVEDFLVNRKQGHCEYFASALALLLRSIDIPARMVNGFKGGDWNELTQSMNVRQKHAHSWVEAYIGKDERNRPRWITLDPTPGLERERRSPRSAGSPRNFRPFTDMVRYVWVFYILGYDSRPAEPAALHAAEVGMIAGGAQGLRQLWGWPQKGFARLFDFQNLASFISVRGFVVSFLVLLAGGQPGEARGLAGPAAPPVVARADRRLVGADRGHPLLPPAGAAARRVRPERTTAETQNEFALRAPGSSPGRDADAARGRCPPEGRRRVLSGAIRPPGARPASRSRSSRRASTRWRHRLSNPLPES